MKGRVLLFAAVILVAGRTSSQQAPANEVPQFPLHSVETAPVGVGDSGFWGDAQCDQDGYVYWRAGSDVDFESSPVWKISPKGEKLAEYSLPNELAEKLLLGRFSVTPDGTLYGVAYGNLTGQVFLLHFGSDGQVSSKTKLAVSEHLIPGLVAVFPTGETLLYGQLDKEAPAAGERQERLAIYAPDGRLLAPVRLPRKKTAEKHSSKNETAANDPSGNETAESGSNALPQRAVAIGEDGNAYLLLGTQIFVVTAHGRVARTIQLSNVPSGFVPTNIQASQGILSVKFTKAEIGKPGVQIRFRTIEAATRTVQADYLPDPDLGAAQLCFTANEGYRFYIVKDKKVYFARGWIK